MANPHQHKGETVTEDEKRSESSFAFFLNNKEEIMYRHENHTRGQQNKNSKENWHGAVPRRKEELHDPTLPDGYKKTKYLYKTCSEIWVKNGNGKNDADVGAFNSYEKYDKRGKLIEHGTHKDGFTHSFDDAPSRVKYDEDGNVCEATWKRNGAWAERPDNQPNKVVREDGVAQSYWCKKGGVSSKEKPPASKRQNKVVQQSSNFVRPPAAALSQSALEPINGVHADSAKKFIDIYASGPVQTQIVAIENAINCLERIKTSLTHQESITPFQSPSLH